MRRFLHGISVLLTLPAIAVGAPAELVERAPARPGPALTLTGGGAVYLFREQGYPGLSLNFSGHVGSGLFLGIETGVGYRERDATTPVTVSLEWRLRGRGLRPYLGAAVGGVVEWGGTRSPTWRLAMIAKPGAEIGLGETLALRIEPRIGFFGRDFVFAPVLGATVAL